ncbi:MAG: hypothetical protein HC921_11420 [Synechococcaceae cyanobacterium SM2_3_1]|nr:hypothetical protein [Synechococcaceae cyanobacterium SM2_3_1]
MSIRGNHLGLIIKTAEDLSSVEKPCPSLENIQARTGLSREEMIAALKFEPNPLGWHLQEDHKPNCSSFVISGVTYARLAINRFVE